jgi:hypothetical protein
MLLTLDIKICLVAKLITQKINKSEIPLISPE